MITLTEFLLARLAEDHAKVVAMRREQTRVRTAPIFQSHPLGWLDSVDIFVSPDRWQAEVEVKRTMIHHLDALDQDATWPIQARNLAQYTLKLLALPHAEHVDYRQEWKP